MQPRDNVVAETSTPSSRQRGDRTQPSSTGAQLLHSGQYGMSNARAGATSAVTAVTAIGVSATVDGSSGSTDQQLTSVGFDHASAGDGVDMGSDSEETIIDHGDHGECE